MSIFLSFSQIIVESSKRSTYQKVKHKQFILLIYAFPSVLDSKADLNVTAGYDDLLRLILRKQMKIYRNVSFDLQSRSYRSQRSVGVLFYQYSFVSCSSLLH